MSALSCHNFEKCSSPLCPLDPISLANGAWFPDEEFCRRKDYAGLGWVRRQKRFAQATGRDSSRGCFRVEMLSHPCRTVKGIRGLDPNEGPTTQERGRKWIAARAQTSGKVPSGRRFITKNQAGTAPLATPADNLVSQSG